MSESLKDKVTKGSIWSLADNLAGSGISFLVGIILARILSPDEFGIIGMVTIFVSVANSIVDSGFSSALIRKNDISDIDYNTVFYTNLTLSLILYSLLYFCAPLISLFFNEPQLVSIIRVLCLVLIINALAIVQRTILVKKIDFKTQTKVSVISSVASGVVGIAMALNGFKVWSLVGQQLSRQFFNAFFLWYFNRWQPSFEFSKNSFKVFFNFGSKLLVAGLIDTIWNNLYYLVIGKFYSAYTLGQYSRAQQFQSIFSSNFTVVIQRVSYPALCTIQDEQERLKFSYRKIIKISALIIFAFMFLMVGISKPLILVLIGEKWVTCIRYLQILCLSSLLYPLSAINLNILIVKGRSDLFLKLEVVKKCVGLFPLLLGILINVEWMLWAGVVVSFISYYINSYYSGKLIGYTMKEQIIDIIPFFVVSLLSSVVVWGITLLGMSNLITLLIQLIVGCFIIISVYDTIKQEEYLDLKQIVFKYFKILFFKNKH